jgi:hypothetical protein
MVVLNFGPAHSKSKIIDRFTYFIRHGELCPSQSTNVLQVMDVGLTSHLEKLLKTSTTCDLKSMPMKRIHSLINLMLQNELQWGGSKFEKHELKELGDTLVGCLRITTATTNKNTMKTTTVDKKFTLFAITND